MQFVFIDQWRERYNLTNLSLEHIFESVHIIQIKNKNRYLILFYFIYKYITVSYKIIVGVDTML